MTEPSKPVLVHIMIWSQARYLEQEPYVAIMPKDTLHNFWKEAEDIAVISVSLYS